MMRKHILLRRKNEVINKMPWYVRLSEGDLTCFSIQQLNILNEILCKAEQFREDCNPWYPLDVHKIVRKPIGDEPEKIIELNKEGARIVSRDYIDTTAASSILRLYDSVY